MAFDLSEAAKKAGEFVGEKVADIAQEKLPEGKKLTAAQEKEVEKRVGDIAEDCVEKAGEALKKAFEGKDKK